MPQKLIAVVGPTASGKTDYAFRLAKELGGEIISVDSRQVYKFLRIGTAKPQGEWKTPGASPGLRPPSPTGRGAGGEATFIVDGIPYHLVDFWDPAKAFTAADFVELATEKIKAIRARKKQPILVGGTGLYFKALLEGLAPLPSGDDSLRLELKKTADTQGRLFLHQELAKMDPEAARKIPANNIQRVVRAIEVFKLTGKPISLWHQEHQSKRQKESSYALEAFGIDLPRDILQSRIEKRCREMLSQGLIEETQQLLEKGYSADCPAFTGLGYPRVLAYLKGTISQEELLTLLIRDTRQYAKRQLTWFRHQMKAQWKTF